MKNTYPYTSTRYDYECSLTLDTGKKLQGQRDKYENDIKPSGIPFYFLWWFDAPHLKGIFYMNAEDVFDYWDNVGTLHNRKEREGDKIAKQIKGKIYKSKIYLKIAYFGSNSAKNIFQKKQNKYKILDKITFLAFFYFFEKWQKSDFSAKYGLFRIFLNF